MEKKDGRKNNGRPKLEDGEKRAKLTGLWAKEKNHAKILAKVGPIIKRMDK